MSIEDSSTRTGPSSLNLSQNDQIVIPKFSPKTTVVTSATLKDIGLTAISLILALLLT